MPFKFIFKKSEIIKGAIVFGVFDSLAALILGESSWLRMIGMILIGGSIYAIEIPSYFAWIEHKSKTMSVASGKWFKTLMAVAYFNPLWIARHMCFIYLLNQQALSWGVLDAACLSFFYGMPVSAAANYVIQNKISNNHRFLASSLFSGCMAIFYAVSAVIFK
jgi:hypothetical protein